ncbi:hypothetical protein HK103_001375 [Boothiomyces macroporosus]|uniref:Uncharacterized protein n=1 Tax=Boothiomyces macroporosus TaxID=261099 RepID=A0AAD5Y341_9FUNG|nr:hypothetical protein HK103_001375 [Boothiomyces macroporosus]
MALLVLVAAKPVQVVPRSEEVKDFWSSLKKYTVETSQEVNLDHTGDGASKKPVLEMMQTNTMLMDSKRQRHYADEMVEFEKDLERLEQLESQYHHLDYCHLSNPLQPYCFSTLQCLTISNLEDLERMHHKHSHSDQYQSNDYELFGFSNTNNQLDNPDLVVELYENTNEALLNETMDLQMINEDTIKQDIIAHQIDDKLHQMAKKYPQLVPVLQSEKSKVDSSRQSGGQIDHHIISNQGSYQYSYSGIREMIHNAIHHDRNHMLDSMAVNNANSPSRVDKLATANPNPDHPHFHVRNNVHNAIHHDRSHLDPDSNENKTEIKKGANKSDRIYNPGNVHQQLKNIHNAIHHDRTNISDSPVSKKRNLKEQAPVKSKREIRNRRIGNVPMQEEIEDFIEQVQPTIVKSTALGKDLLTRQILVFGNYFYHCYWVTVGDQNAIIFQRNC